MDHNHQREMQEIIVMHIASILDHVYHEPVSTISLDDITARVAFKADPLLNELRLALQRLERGEYGHCIFCKGEISLGVLRTVPTAHFCEHCASILRCRTHGRVHAEA